MSSLCWVCTVHETDPDYSGTEFCIPRIVLAFSMLHSLLLFLDSIFSFCPISTASISLRLRCELREEKRFLIVYYHTPPLLHTTPTVTASRSSRFPNSI